MSYQAKLALRLPPGLAVPGPQAPFDRRGAKVPGDLASARLGLLGSVVETVKVGSILSVRVARTEAPLRAPDRFVEGAAKGSPGRPELTLADAGNVATLRAPIRGERAAALAGTPLRFTLVNGERSAETEVVPPLGTLLPMAGERCRSRSSVWR